MLEDADCPGFVCGGDDRLTTCFCGVGRHGVLHGPCHLMWKDNVKIEGVMDRVLFMV